MIGPPLDNGAITVENQRVKWIGRWRDCPNEAGQHIIDLGEVALLPGLINTHCHLDYTNMAGQIPPPKTFPDWVKTILSFKSHWSFSEFAESWLKGARMLIDHGTTTVCDVESVPELPPETWKSTPLRMISFFEMTGVKSQRNAEDLLQEAMDWMERWPKDDRKEGGLSPHALYSTAPDLMRKAASEAEKHDLLLCTHLAESEAEYQMYTDAAGPFFDWLKGQRKMEDCGRLSPIQLAHEYAVLNERSLIVHANYLRAGDIDLIAASGATVVHCPRSHEYFGHTPFRYAELIKAGVNVCIATDSLASCRKIGTQSPELNLWDEMQFFAKRNPAVSPHDILRMVTTHGAKAVRKNDEIGGLATGMLADMATLPYGGKIQEERICEEMLYSAQVRDVMIGGEWVKTAV